jgi:Contractile injection system tube protein
MTPLKKATLQEISAGKDAKTLGEPIPVQFNPESLKLSLSNKIEGGDTRGKQTRQYLGKSSTTLSFDLYFDTTDLGTTNEPVSVRTQTALVERFVLPKGTGNKKQKPPKCRFYWGHLQIDGIIDDISIDFELFASDGTPLRAKIGVSIKEQDSKYELLQSERASLPGQPGGGTTRGADNTSPPGAPGVGPGSRGRGPTDSSAQALAGESVADFAARMGLDPSAWRGIAGQLGASSSLSLKAGVSVDFDSTLAAGAGVGVSAGVEFDASASVEASFGLDASGGANVSAGFALSAAGGLGAALETVAIVQAESAAADARRSFGPAVPPTPIVRPPAVNVSAGATAVGPASIPAASTAAIHTALDLPPPSITPKPALPDQTRTPLQIAARTSSPSRQRAAPSAPPPPLADPRATSFGLGVPLRPRVGSAADLRAGLTAGRVPLRPRAPVTSVLDSTNPSDPPWTRLPPDHVRNAADQAQASRFPARPCNCGSGCK